MRQLLVLGFTTLAYTGLAQTKSGVVNGADSKAQIYKVADQPPHADYDANVYIDASIEYPDSAFRKGIEGTVTVQFVVNEDSAISDCKILKGIGGGCDEEALRIVRGMPKWGPGKVHGEAVKVYDTLSLVFNIPKRRIGAVGAVSMAEENDDDDVIDPTQYRRQYPKVYEHVEEEPKAPYDMNEYVRKNMRYPVKSRNGGKGGEVVVRFIVNEDGTISSCKVVSGIDRYCDWEALRLIASMPQWIPGKENGQAVKVYFNQTIKFKL